MSSLNLLIKELETNRNKAIRNFIFECCKNSPAPISDMKKINKQMLKTTYPTNEVLINNLEEMKVIASEIDFNKIDYKKICMINGEADQFNKYNDCKFIQNVKIMRKMGHLPFYSSCEDVIESIKSFL